MVTRDGRGPTDDEFREEIESHLALETDRLIADGVSPADARTNAHRTVGNTTRIRERFYESRRVMWLEDAVQDLRFTFRSLRRAPGFAAVAILTLAIGLGASTAVFSVINAVLLRPLPYTDPDRLVVIEHPEISSPQWLLIRWAARARSVAGFAGFQSPTSATLAAETGPASVNAASVTPNFFSLLGVSPAAGRLFSDTDVQAGSFDVAIVSYSFWRAHFGGDAGVVGRTITLTGQRLVIVGVLNERFRFPTIRRAGWTQPGADTQPDVIRLWDEHSSVTVISRLQPASTPASATVELQAIFADEAPVHFNERFWKRGQFAATLLQERLAGDTRRGLLSTLR